MDVLAHDRLTCLHCLSHKSQVSTVLSQMGLYVGMSPCERVITWELNSIFRLPRTGPLAEPFNDSFGWVFRVIADYGDGRGTSGYIKVSLYVRKQLTVPLMTSHLPTHYTSLSVVLHLRLQLARASHAGPTLTLAHQRSVTSGAAFQQSAPLAP